MAFWVYVLYSEVAKRYYVGHTQNLVDRLRQHNSGETTSTRYGIPWCVVNTETFSTRAEAMRREKQIKNRGVARYLKDIKVETV